MFWAAASLGLVYHFSRTWTSGCQGCTELQSRESCLIPVCPFLQTVHGRGCQTGGIWERTKFILRRYKNGPHQANSPNFTVQYFSTHNQTQQQQTGVELNNHFLCSTRVWWGNKRQQTSFSGVFNLKIIFSEIAFLHFIYIHANSIWFSKLNSTFHLQITALNKERSTPQFALYKWEAGRVLCLERKDERECLWGFRKSSPERQKFPSALHQSLSAPEPFSTHSCSDCSPDCSHSRV